MYQRDRGWGDSYEAQVRRILMPLLAQCVELAVAPEGLDNNCATDFTFTLVGGSIAVRLRRSTYTFRDLTIRAKRDTGVKTELQKIKEGHASRYFYGWIDEKNTIAEWILVDMDKVRKTRILEKDRPLKDNHDGTYFIAIPVGELRYRGCLIADALKGAYYNGKGGNV